CFQSHPEMGQSTIWEVWRYMKPGDSNLKKLLSSLIVAAEIYLPIFVAAASAYVATRLFDQERVEQPTPQISLRRFSLVIAAQSLWCRRSDTSVCLPLLFIRSFLRNSGEKNPTSKASLLRTMTYASCNNLESPLLPANQT